MAIEQKGEFVVINNNSVRISEIISVKPESWVHVDYDGKITNRDFPKIIVVTKNGAHQFLYGDDKQRDEALISLNEIIGSYQVKSIEATSGSTTINVTGSNGVNIISNSTQVSISQEKINEAKGILSEFKIELEKQTEINKELKEDISSVLSEVENQIANNGEIKRHSFRSLLGISSDFASLSGLAVSLGQLLGFL